ncbi:MAG: FKBP-type peptidyl-prolyl cis-trans isomerase [Gammaproteobacteria bacterium]
MKIMNYIVALMLMASSLNVLAEVKPESDREKLSYSMGIFFGQTVTRQNIDVDIPAFIQAVEDVLSNKELKLDMDEMQQILSAYQQKEQEQRSQKASSNLEEGEQYLAENKARDGVVELDSGLQYKVIEKGEGASPEADDTVVVHYRGTLLDGTEFDSSYSRGEPAALGVNRVIKGWQEALQLMKVGSKWQIAVPAELAYGDRGAGNVIGPNSTLLFDIELLEIQ